MTENDYKYYTDILSDILTEYCGQDQKRKNMFSLFGGKRFRKLKVRIEEVFPEISSVPQINAYSFYDSSEDSIYIYRYLIRVIANIMEDSSKTRKEYNWLFYCALFFCCFHEFSHLYLGHCQLMPGGSLAMSYSAQERKKHEMSLDMQTMEIEADALAAQLLGDYVVGCIKSGEYRRVYGYETSVQFYCDTIKAVCGFFSMIRYLEYKEQLSKFKRKDKEPYTHPSYLLRLYYAGFYFMEYVKQFAGVPYKSKVFEYYVVNMSEVFGHYPLSEKEKQEQYDEIYSKEFVDGLQLVAAYDRDVLEPKLVGRRRANPGVLFIKYPFEE